MQTKIVVPDCYEDDCGGDAVGWWEGRALCEQHMGKGDPFSPLTASDLALRSTCCDAAGRRVSDLRCEDVIGPKEAEPRWLWCVTGMVGQLADTPEARRVCWVPVSVCPFCGDRLPPPPMSLAEDFAAELARRAAGAPLPDVQNASTLRTMAALMLRATSDGLETEIARGQCVGFRLGWRWPERTLHLERRIATPLEVITLSMQVPSELGDQLEAAVAKLADESAVTGTGRTPAP